MVIVSSSALNYECKFLKFYFTLAHISLLTMTLQFFFPLYMYIQQFVLKERYHPWQIENYKITIVSGTIKVKHALSIKCLYNWT